MIQQHAGPVPAAPARPLILVVDDVLENRFIVQRRLERMGYDCVLADGGPAALNMVRAMAPQLVLLDFMMPGMDGLMVLRELRASPASANMPVIMLTARTDSDSIVSALDEGADDYVIKPIDFSALKARMDASLLRRGAALALAEANSRLDARAAAQAVELGAVRDLLHAEFRRVHDLEDELRRQVPRQSSALVQVAQSLRRIADACGELEVSTEVDQVKVAARSMRDHCVGALEGLRAQNINV